MKLFFMFPTNWVILLRRTMKNAKVVSTHVVLKCQLSIVAFLLALSSCNVLFTVSDSNCCSHMQNSNAYTPTLSDLNLKFKRPHAESY